MNPQSGDAGRDVSTRDRAIGALLGLAAGDAVGTTLEFQHPGSFTPITDMVGGGPFSLPAGAWTDDTSMALCLAESLLDTGRMNLGDQLRRYVLWRDHGYLSSTGTCFDIGGATTTQLDRFLRTGEPVDVHPDQDAAANGSLMRLAPVAIRWHTDPGEAAEQSAESSRTTHAAERPVDACRLLGSMTAALINGVPAEQVLSPRFWQWGTLHPQVEAIAMGSWRTKEPPEIRGTGYCVAALEAAIWAVAGASSFATAVLRAANLGDDADTTAAIAGQLAGARWGASGIPSRWSDQIVLRDRIEALARGLATAGDSRLDPSKVWGHDAAQHAWWVEPGAVLAGEYPGKIDGDTRSIHTVNLLVDAGVRTFVDLTEPHELDPYEPHVRAAAAARQLDLRRVHLPIRDQHTVDDQGYDTILRAIDDGRQRGVVYLHCWGGIGRTGTVAGCLLARDGLDYETVIHRLGQLRAGTRKAHRASPENDEQRAVLRRRTAARGPVTDRS